MRRRLLGLQHWKCLQNTAIVSVLNVILQARIADGESRHAGNVGSRGRYVVPLHQHRVPVRSDDTDTISFKSTYFGRVTVGAPEPQAFDVVFDTGSGHLIIPDSECTSSACHIHNKYVGQASTSAQDIDHDGTVVPAGAPRDQITIAFGTGEVTGQFVHDRLCIGPKSHADNQVDQFVEAGSDKYSQRQTRTSAGNSSLAAGSTFGQVLLQKGSSVFKGPSEEFDDEHGDQAELNCVDMRVVTAVEMSDDPFTTFTFDGVLGLGLDGLSLAPEFNVFGMLSSTVPLAQASFGVFLADGDEEVSELSLGGHSPELMWDEPTFAPVVTPDLGYWQVQINALRIGNKTVDFCDDGQCRAVVDTGTSLLAVPKEFAYELQTELDSSLMDPRADPAAAPGEGVNCRDAQGTPLHFDMDGFTVTLEAGDYSRQAVQFQEDGERGPVLVPTEAFRSDPSAPARSCWPTIMPVDFAEPMGPKLFIWGEPVLRKYYTVYNWQDKSVGFGLAKHFRAVEAGGPVAAQPPDGPRRRPLLD